MFSPEGRARFRQQYHSHPSGPGSLLDADTVDGKQAADFLLASTTGMWAGYTPTVTQSGTVTSVTITRARYCQIGKTVHVALRIDFTGATGAVGNNPIRVSLPVTAQAATQTVGTAFYFDTGAAIYPCTARFNSTTSVQFFRSDYQYGSVVPVGQDPNFTVANGDWIETTFTYEAA